MAKILVADDSLAELQIIQQTLQSTGHSIVTVMDGEAAEEKAKSEKFDLIILDVIMPKKNGFGLPRYQDQRRDQECTGHHGDVERPGERQVLGYETACR